MRIRFKSAFPFISFQTRRQRRQAQARFVPHIPSIKHVGKYTYSSPDLYITNTQETTIGSFCSIGRGVCLGWGRHPTGYLSTSPYLYADYLGFKTQATLSHNEYIRYTPPVHIGNDVWIGDFAVVANGISVGDGAIIAAHAVVTKDVAPYAVVGGVPAKLIKYRFAPDICAALQQLPWWTLPDETIRQIPYDDIDKTLVFLRRYFPVSNSQKQKENPVQTN